MYALIDGRWLLSVSDEIVATDFKENVSYSAPQVPEFADVIRESADGKVFAAEFSTSLHCEVENSNLAVQLTKKMASGLEFKPKVMVLRARTGDAASALLDLVSAYRETSSRLNEAREELNLANEANRDMAVEKSELQEITLQRVCAILEERNFWIDKFKTMKSEPTEFNDPDNPPQVAGPGGPALSGDHD